MAIETANRQNSGQLTDGPRPVAVMMSRRRELIRPGEPWLTALVGTLRRIAADGSELVVGDGIAGSEFIRRAAFRLGISCRSVVRSAELSFDDQLPVEDQALMAAADVVYALDVRDGGNLHRMLRARLQQSHRTVIVVDVEGCQSDSVRSELCQDGARLWRPTAEQLASLHRLHSVVSDTDQITTKRTTGLYLIAPFPGTRGWDLLTHTTRARPGPWPDESRDDYVDSLLEDRLGADHSTLNVLQRIVSQKRLIASDRTIRGQYRVVSFTACPLGTLPALHRFRHHLRRWDFEPFGICLKRDWLLRHGARRVLYGDEAIWNGLTDADRPFFQVAAGRSGIDWTAEQEWRMPGDLSLTDVTANEVLLFVPDFQAAKSLAQFTDWPITLWPANYPDLASPSIQ